MTSTSLHRSSISAFILAVSIGAAGSAAAQNEAAIGKARELYAGAAYEEALVALGSSQSAESRQYRALCLMALGRAADAESELVSLVTGMPTFRVDEDVPPRFETLFKDVKRKVLPGVIRQLFTDARNDFQAKAFDAAVPRFERVVALSGEPAVKDVESLNDIRLLASSFLDLAKAGAPPAATPASAPAAVSAPAPASTSVSAPRTAAAAPPPPSAAVVEPNGRASAAGIATPPVVVKQEIPAWPATLRRGPGTVTGAVKVVITREGTVREAAMETPIHPVYDREVLAAAKTWRYKPAEWNGSPIEAEKIISISVNGR